MKCAAMYPILIVLLTAIFLVAGPSVAPAADKELPDVMPNGSFEKAADGKPAGWQVRPGAARRPSSMPRRDGPANDP